MKSLITIIIRLYQVIISPLKPPRYRCKYYPTCSSYMIKAIQRFGVLKGSILGWKRILSCHPWSPGGYDPVPVVWSWKNNEQQKLLSDSSQSKKKDIGD